MYNFPWKTTLKAGKYEVILPASYFPAMGNRSGKCLYHKAICVNSMRHIFNRR